ncbi:MAG: hypothetical protein ABSH34_11475 [Verrucomicrobiota bacterium]|jgi:hypothetical protein
MSESVLEKLDPKIVGERLKSARRACGLSPMLTIAAYCAGNQHRNNL